MQSSQDRAESIIRAAKQSQPESSQSRVVYVTTTRNKENYVLDNSALYPTPTTFLAPGYDGVAAAYYKELEASLFDHKTDRDIQRVQELCKLYRYTHITGQSVQITSAKAVRSLPVFVSALNKFITANSSAIASISSMLYGEHTQEA